MSNASNYAGTVGLLKVMRTLSAAWTGATQRSLLLSNELGFFVSCKMSTQKFSFGDLPVF